MGNATEWEMWRMVISDSEWGASRSRQIGRCEIQTISQTILVTLHAILNVKPYPSKTISVDLAHSRNWIGLISASESTKPLFPLASCLVLRHSRKILWRYRPLHQNAQIPNKLHQRSTHVPMLRSSRDNIMWCFASYYWSVVGQDSWMVRDF